MPISKNDLHNIIKENSCTVFFETGFYQGNTVSKILDLDLNKIVSIELLKKFCDFGEQKFKKEIEEGKISIINDDCANIGNYLHMSEGEKVCFWLDGHLDNGLNTSICKPKDKSPVMIELSAIKEMKRKDHVILVDDLRIITRGNWNSGVSYTIDDLKNKILEINKDYKFKLVDGYCKDDVLMAYV